MRTLRKLKAAIGALTILSNPIAALANSYRADIIEYGPNPVNAGAGVSVAEEFSITLMFDEVTTNGNFLWPEGYGNLEWSANHYIFNESEQKLFPRNHATSPPNLLFVQDSSHTGGVEPYFQVRPNSPAPAFDLHQISILPFTAAPRAPVLFSIMGYPAKGGPAIVRWYKWTMDSQLQYPWDAEVKGVDAVSKVEVFVIPGDDVKSTRRLPYTLDNVKITWRTPLNRAGNAHLDGSADADVDFGDVEL